MIYLFAKFFIYFFLECPQKVIDGISLPSQEAKHIMSIHNDFWTGKVLMLFKINFVFFFEKLIPRKFSTKEIVLKPSLSTKWEKRILCS